MLIKLVLNHSGPIPQTSNWSGTFLPIGIKKPLSDISEYFCLSRIEHSENRYLMKCWLSVLMRFQKGFQHIAQRLGIPHT